MGIMPKEAGGKGRKTAENFFKYLLTHTAECCMITGRLKGRSLR